MVKDYTYRSKVGFKLNHLYIALFLTIIPTEKPAPPQSIANNEKAAG